MGADNLNKLREQALELPEDERAELAHALMKSLDGATEAGAAEAWDRELLRRLAAVEAGTARLIDRDELRRRMRTRLGRR